MRKMIFIPAFLPLTLTVFAGNASDNSNLIMNSSFEKLKIAGKKKVSSAIVICKGSSIYVDNFCSMSHDK